MKRDEALAHAIHAQQLDRTPGPEPLTEAAIFDLGIQDTGRDGASWALANRGFGVTSAAQLESDPDVALAWTLRSAPHYYRRTDLADVMVATSPFSDADAAKRMVGAGKPLHDAGIEVRAGLNEVARLIRDLVAEPRRKGEVSTALSAQLDPPYLRECLPCKATHVWEVPFRVAALYGGLELQPGTSPPMLRRIPGWDKPPGPAADPAVAPLRLQVIRNYLRFFGPTTPKEVSEFLDSTVSEVKNHWPEDAVEVELDGFRSWVLADAELAEPADIVKLLGSHDLLLQTRNRALLVPDRSLHKALWPVIGRPGAVLVGTEIVGLWRPRAEGKKFALRLEPWVTLSPRTRSRVTEEAERLAVHRGATLSVVEGL